MKKFKGTEEEWVQGATFFSEEEEQPVYWIDIRVGDNKIASVKGIHYDIPNEECIANAKLIAAAPELLKALQESQKYLVELGTTESGEAYYNNMQAINKAL
mgnify:CR=1 FL=1|tara:strand:+ start:3121 stop:3423 length:303 start_codon:yes stop_codon:yes gene_type:complete